MPKANRRAAPSRAAGNLAAMPARSGSPGWASNSHGASQNSTPSRSRLSATSSLPAYMCEVANTGRSICAMCNCGNNRRAWAGRMLMKMPASLVAPVAAAAGEPSAVLLATAGDQFGLECTRRALREIVARHQHVGAKQAAFGHVVGRLGTFGFRQQAEFAGVAGGQLLVVRMVQRQHRHGQLGLAEDGGDLAAR